LGYYKDPQKSAATFRVINGRRYSITGDLATVDAAGNITVLGRGSACINTGGEKVYPEEVEEVLKRHRSVQDVVVLGVPDERLGEQVAAIVQLNDGHELDLVALQDHARTTLAGYKVPRRFVVVPQVVRGPNGKVDYAQARASVAAEPVGA
jgi:acyl-CoA synthetase (AMP-forming)/AMP-acid ligase II